MFYLKTHAPPVGPSGKPIFIGSSGGGRCCCWCEKTRMAFRVLFKQQKQHDRRATQRDHSDQDAASSRDGRARHVARCWERRRRHNDDSRRSARAFKTSPRLASAIFAPSAQWRASAESHVLWYVPPAVENTTKERNGRALHRGVGAQPVAVVRITQGNQFDRIPPNRARGAIRLAEPTRHTNMRERALSLSLNRTSLRFCT